MGTPVACVWAMIYFWWYEKHVIIPKYGKLMPVMLRFIDDIYAIVLVGGEDGISMQNGRNSRKICVTLEC